jgi:penicillin-binding protein 1C
VPDGRDPEVGYWALADLPPRVVAPTLAIEDRRFWHHPGVDPLAVVRSVGANVRAGRRASGASTIAMQVARLEHPGRRTYPRKLVEAASALFMTARYGRAAVLGQYLRLAPYGNRIRGIAYAARRYLGKPVEDLSWAETAFLAAIPQAPARMNPYRAEGRGRAVERGRRILDTLRAEHVLGADQYELAVAQLVALRVPPLGRRPPGALHALLGLERMLGARPPAAPLVDTTLDLDVQQAVATMVAEAVGALEGRGAGNAAAIVLERGTNRVVAWVGSAGYFDARHAGAYDYTRVRRSPGSTLKPFLFAFALERGAITPATILDDVLRTPGDITNADEAFLGPLLPRVALANSRNVPAANLLDRVGLDDGYAFLRDLGLHDGERPARHWGLGIAIGAMPVTLDSCVPTRCSRATGGPGSSCGIAGSRSRRRAGSSPRTRRVR